MMSRQRLGRNRGVSLIELMFGLILAGTALWLAFAALHSEARLSNRVQTRSELAQEARTILQWLREDLRTCCQPLSGGRFRPSLYDAIERQTADGQESVSFLCFSRQVPIETAVPVRTFGKGVRLASRVTWRLVSPTGTAGNGGSALERLEQIPASGSAGVWLSKPARRFSDRVRSFSIRPVTIGKNGEQIQVLRVSLSLKTPGDRADGAKPDLEWFDVVCPSFFQSTWSQHGIRHPWHTVISGP